MEELVSHGVDEETDRIVIMSCEPIEYYKKNKDVIYDPILREWYIYSEKDEND